MNRIPAPGGLKGPDGKPATVLPDGTLLKDTYRSEFLAVGGMSVAYRVRSGEEVWLAKEVPAGDARSLLALGQEKSLLERLDHPSIVKSHEMFEENGYYYLVREYVEGETLEQALPAEGFLSEKVVLEWSLRLCNVLGYLHSQTPPVIYRDLKPKNVLRDPHGKLVLFDFGIARSFKEGKLQDTINLGSALTASPEHYGGQTDARSDLYTLGATIHYLLTGGRGERESPFQWPAVREVNGQVSERLERVIARCLEKKPDQRYQSAAELAQALLECNTQGTSAPLAAARPVARRPRWWLALLPLAALLLLLARPHPASEPTPTPRPLETSRVLTTPAASPTPVTVLPMETPGPVSATPSPTASQAPPPLPSASPTARPTVAIVRPLVVEPDYPQSHGRPASTPLALPPLLLDTGFAQAERRPVAGWVEQAGIRYLLPSGFEQIDEGVYVKGKNRGLHLLAVRPLQGTGTPEDFARLRQGQTGEETTLRPLTVSQRAAVEWTLRRREGRRLLICTELYTTSPAGVGWCISAVSARIERPELEAELDSLLTSISWR